jgi:hypothetical protein
MDQMSRALQITREAAAGTQDDAIRHRLTRLVAEQEHCLTAMNQYLQEALSSCLS